VTDAVRRLGRRHGWLERRRLGDAELIARRSGPADEIANTTNGDDVSALGSDRSSGREYDDDGLFRRRPRRLRGRWTGGDRFEDRRLRHRTRGGVAARRRIGSRELQRGPALGHHTSDRDFGRVGALEDDERGLKGRQWIERLVEQYAQTGAVAYLDALNADGRGVALDDEELDDRTMIGDDDGDRVPLLERADRLIVVGVDESSQEICAGAEWADVEPAGAVGDAEIRQRVLRSRVGDRLDGRPRRGITRLPIDGPVLNTNDAGCRRMLPRMSAMPGSSVMRYVVLGLNPPFGSIVIRSRCQLTFVGPVRGETRTTFSSVGAPWSVEPATLGCSAMTSSNTTSIFPAVKFVALVSTETLTISAGV
jgi:hypothetical protein